MIEMIADFEVADAVTTLKVTGAETALLDSELVEDLAVEDSDMTTVMVELDITITELISLNGKAVEKAEEEDELELEPETRLEVELELSAELAWFDASVETTAFTDTRTELELLLLELGLVLDAPSLLRLLEIDGLAPELVVKLLRKDIVLLDRKTPVVYVYDMLKLAFDRHEAGIVKQHGRLVFEVVEGANTPE